MKKFLYALFLPLLLIIFVSGNAFAIPSEPPPTGKVWVEVDGVWISVIAPPEDGPYIWKGGAWMLDPASPPPNSQWVPGNWVQGHWKGNKWIPGHWAGSAPHKKKWVPGHRGPGGQWIPGHWK